VALVLLAPALLVSNAAGQSITGRVFERVGTRHVPLRKALVLAGSPDGQQTFAVTRTDTEGRYLLAGEVAGRIRLSASKFGYLLVTAGGKKQPELNINCLESTCGPFDFELVKGGIAAGTVVDDFNEPVRMAYVWVLTPGSLVADASQSHGEGRTDDLGRSASSDWPRGSTNSMARPAGGEEATQAFGPAPCRLISPWEKKSPGSR